MAKNKKIIEKKIIENSFFDIKAPNFEWLKVDLRHIQTTLGGEVQGDDYDISIYMGEKLSYEDKNLSRKVQEILKLNFPPYYWQEKKYRFYTTERTGALDDKKEMLEKLFELFKNYEIENKKNFEDSSQEYENDIKNNLKLETPDLILKLEPKSKRFIVLAKDFLGGENYKLLKSSSLLSSYLINPKFLPENNTDSLMLTTDFFKEEMGSKKIEKKTYFVINPQFYLKVKNHFLDSKVEQEKFISSQKAISNNIDLKSLEIKEDNLFDLKVEFNEKDQCFDFYSKGYFEPSFYAGYRSQRNLLGTWALNFIFSEKQNETANIQWHNEILLDGMNKIILEEVKGGSKKDKNVKIPASEWEKIQKIKENFEKEMLFWGRKTKDIKITHCDFSHLEVFQKFPAIYINDKGECFFAFSGRRMGVFKAIGSAYNKKDDDFMIDEGIPIDENGNEKKKREIKFSQTLKTIPITFEEAKFYINEHPFAEKIKKGTINLNATIHNQTNILSTEENKIEIFNKMMMMAEIASSSNKNTSKPKKIKI